MDEAEREISKIVLSFPTWVPGWLVMVMHGSWSFSFENLEFLMYVWGIPVKMSVKSSEMPVWSSEDRRQITGRDRNLGPLTDPA